jgi:hypothetical protein
MDENEVEWYAAMLDYLGREKGTAYMRALAKQNPQLRRGHSLLSKLLQAGDFRWPWCTPPKSRTERRPVRRSNG